MARKYDWGDGKGKVHSIPLSRHKKNVKTQRRAKLNDPARFIRPRGELDVNRDAEAAAGLRYGGAERELGQQAARIDPWFEKYKSQVQGIAQGIQQGYEKGAADVMARQQATATSDTTARTALGGQMQADAKARGATVDPSLLAGDVNAANVRNTNQAAFSNLLGAQGLAEGAYYGGVQASGSAAQLGEKFKNATAKKDLATERGQYKQTYVSEARDKEHTKNLENKAFDVDVYKAQADVQTDRAKIRADTKKRKADARAKGQTVNKYGYTDKQWRSFSPARRQSIQKKLGPSGTGVKPTKGTAGLTPAERRRQRENANKQVTRIQDVEERWNLYKTQTGKGPDGKTRKPTPSEIKQRLLKEGFKSPEIHLALMWSSNKPWTAKDRQTAKRLGIKLPKRKKAKPVKPTPGLVNPFD